MVDMVRLEKFARGVAANMSKRQAANAAGYSPKSNRCYELAQRPVFTDMLAQFRDERARAGPALAQVILALLDGATRALNEASPAAWSAGTRMLDVAGRFKMKLPEDERARLAGGGEEASLKAWVDEFGPED